MCVFAKQTRVFVLVSLSLPHRRRQNQTPSVLSLHTVFLTPSDRMVGFIIFPPLFSHHSATPTAANPAAASASPALRPAARSTPPGSSSLSRYASAPFK